MVSRLPLRVVLTLPYIALLVLLAGTVGWLSFRAGSEAVGDMAKRLNESIGERIQEATAAYLSNWKHTLGAAAGHAGSEPESTLAVIERELWAAGSLSAIADNYVYFAAPDGRFVGVQRRAEGPALLKLRERPGSLPRTLRDAQAPGDRSGGAKQESQVYDATARPWYLSAVGATNDVWSPVYLDFSSQTPMTTLARARRSADGTLLGVYGADVPLAKLGTFLRELDIARQGMAYIVTGDGRLIASSLPPVASDAARRELLLAAASEDAGLASSYRAIEAQVIEPTGTARQAIPYDTPSGRMLVSAAPLKGRAGVDWWVVVALREDVLTAGITRNAYSTAGLAALAALAVLILGTTVLSGLARDIGKLTRAAEQLSADIAPAPLRIARRDELGRLAQAFNRMVRRLESSTDVIKKQNESLAAHVAELGGEIKARDLAEGRLLTVANSLNEAFVVVDRLWRITFANRRTEPFSGIPAHDAVGRIVWDAFPTAAGSEIEQNLREVMGSGEARTVEVFRPHRNVWLELRMFPSELGLALFFSDVTQRHRTREAQTERQKQIHDLASELLTSQSDERRAIARELHDEFGQQLAAVRINLQILLAGAQDGDVEARLSESLSAVKDLIGQIRNRALDLHPAILDDLGLGPALQWLCERKTQRLGMRIEFQGDSSMRGLPGNVELAAFRIAQEAILNAAKHSDTEAVELKLALEDDHLHLEVQDHGQGFETGAGETVQPGLSLGLVSMRERAEQLGGTLVIHSERGVGTTVVVNIPVKAHA